MDSDNHIHILNRQTCSPCREHPRLKSGLRCCPRCGSSPRWGGGPSAETRRALHKRPAARPWVTSRCAPGAHSAKTQSSSMTLHGGTFQQGSAPTGTERRCAQLLTCSRALSNCLTRSSRSWAGKWRAPTSSSPTLCLVMVIRRSCGERREVDWVNTSRQFWDVNHDVSELLTGTLLSPWTSSSRCFSSFTSSESWIFLSLESLRSWAKSTSIKHQPSQQS